MPEAPTGKHPLADAVAIYTDGGLLSSNPSQIGGSWAWCCVDANDRKLGFKSGLILPPGPEKNVVYADGRPVVCPRVVSNNHSEQTAIVRALEAVPYGWSGTVFTDSEVALKRVQSDYELHLGHRRFPAGELNLYKSISDRSKEAVRRLGVVHFVLLQGHPTKADLEHGIGAKRNLPVSKWNVWCDKRCEMEKKRYYAKIAAEVSV